MMLALADVRISSELESALKKYADTIIKLPPFSRLAKPVSSHPDMLIFEYGDKIYTWKEYFDENPQVFKELSSAGYKIAAIGESASAKYPCDVRLNCARVGNYVIANTRHVSSVISQLALENRLVLLHTNQGYAKCSTVTVSENSLITADESIYRAATDAGLDALKINSGNVRLDGYDTGFIGGATAVTENHVLFCGNLHSHPDAEKIASFCQSHGKNAVSLTNGALYDYGTVMMLNNS